MPKLIVYTSDDILQKIKFQDTKSKELILFIFPCLEHKIKKVGRTEVVNLDLLKRYLNDIPLFDDSRYQCLDLTDIIKTRNSTYSLRSLSDYLKSYLGIT